MTYNVRSSQEARAGRIVHDWGSLTWLAGAELNGSEKITLGRVVIRAGCRNPSHRHNDCDEVLYLMAGRLEHSIDGRTVTLEAGDTLFVPSGSFHHAASTGEVDADMIVAYSSGTRDFEPENPEEIE